MKKTHYRLVIRSLRTNKIVGRETSSAFSYEDLKEYAKARLRVEPTDCIARLYRCSQHYCDLEGYVIRKRGSVYYAARRAVYEKPEQHRVFARLLGLL